MLRQTLSSLFVLAESFFWLFVFFIILLLVLWVEWLMEPLTLRWTVGQDGHLWEGISFRINENLKDSRDIHKSHCRHAWLELFIF